MKYIALVILFMGLWLLSSAIMRQPLINKRGIQRVAAKVMHYSPRKKKMSFKDYALSRLKKKKQNIFATNMQYAENNIRTGGKLKKVKRSCLWTGIVLAIIAILFKNYILAPVAYACGRLIPLWIYKATSYKNRKYLLAELEATLNGVTATYCRTEDIVSAVETNLQYMSEPTKSDFARFVYEIRYVNPSIDNALISLSATNDNEIFQEWIRTLRRCINNTQLKYGLYPVITKFTDIKDIQGEIDTMMRQPFADFVVLCVIGAIVPPAATLLYPSIFGVVSSTLVGNIMTSAMIVVIMFGIDKAIELLEPITLKRGGAKR